MGKKISALIPAFNCEKTIGDVVERTKNYIEDIFVVNDGSRDKTTIEALKAGAQVLELKENSGKGYAIQKGLGIILKQNYDGVLFLDGDGQHKPEEIPKFLEAFEDCDLVIGVRRLKLNNYPPLRRIPNNLGGLFLKGMTGLDLEDWQCGFRLASVDFLKKIPKIFKRYEMESQMLIIASHLKIKIKEVEVETLTNKSSYYKSVKDTFFICLYSMDLFYERKKTQDPLDPIFLLK